jgi:hypothetical protein
MVAGSRHVLRAAAVVLFVALAVPAAALADGGSKCSASACKVYHEQGPPTGGGHKPPPKGPTSSNQGGGTQGHASKSYSRVLAHLGPDKGAVKNLLGQEAPVDNVASGSAGGSPSILGAAFDLGAGPTVLLAILLGTALGLAARGRVGGWLSKRSRS